MKGFFKRKCIVHNYRFRSSYKALPYPLAGLIFTELLCAFVLDSLFKTTVNFKFAQ